MKQILITLIVSLFISGCSRNIPTPNERLHVADTLAQNNSLHVKTFKTKNFDIYTYSTQLFTCKTLNVYIEGDGLAWITSSLISDNPTPIHPTALKLMIQDSSTCRLYLARPCQYVSTSTCKEKYWTSHRFSQEVIESYKEILDTFKDKTFTLFGYSGGGAVATLISAQRDDVIKLVTIAGNLDIDYWAKKHYLTPLKGSLNPADFSDKLTKIKQWHLIGGKDSIIDKSIYDSYISHFTDTSHIKHKLYKNFTHSCCWEEEWKNILKEID